MSWTVLALPGTQKSSTGEVEDNGLLDLCALLVHTGKFRSGGDSFLVPGMLCGSCFWAFAGSLHVVLSVMAGVSCQVDAI